MGNQKDSTIIASLSNGADEEAFEKAFALLQDFKEFERTVLLLNSQFSAVHKKDNLGTADRNYVDVSTNHTRYALMEVLNDFREKTLSRYFDIAPFRDEIENIQNQESLILKVMRLRLEPMGYRLAKGVGESVDTPLKVIHGQSSVLIPLEKEEGTYAMAQVLRKVSLGEEEGEHLQKIVGLRHRNLIKMLHCQVHRYPFFVIREYVHGKTLADSIRTVGPRPVSQVVDWLYQLAEALLYLSQKNIDHFNVRPSKIFIDDEFHLLISPLNLEGDSSKQEGGGIEHKHFWEICRYGSPELLEKYGPAQTALENERFVCASTQFSMGAVAYYLLTGKELFQGETVKAVLAERDAFEKNPESRLSELGSLPKFKLDGQERCLSEIIQKLLRPKKEERFENLYSLIKELHRMTHAECAERNEVQMSYRRAVGNNRELMRDFYDKLLEKSAVAKEKFAAYQSDKLKMNRQYSMLQMAVDILINIDKPGNESRLKEILFAKSGGQNAHLGLSDHDYSDFFEVLLTCIAQSDPSFHKTPLTKSEWERVRDHFLETVKRLRPQGP